ncbi:MAG: response regulator, partial [Deltaproteobacteria bacterium]|nr:response regulator [Deltaproteobacteria bacterium]
MHFRKILIVDDDEAIREICSEALIMTGYSVERASNGLEAFESLQSFNFDAVVSDIDMPLLDGISFYINAINDFPYLRDRFLFISGAISREKIALLTDFKRSYLRKPFKISELIEHIEKVISNPLSTPGTDTLEKRRWTRYKWMAFCKIAEQGSTIEKEIAAKIRGVSRYGMEIV